MDIETLAKELHEAGREAVEKGATVAAEKFGEKTRVFLPWDEISETAKEGRRIQAKYLLGKYMIIPLASLSSGFDSIKGYNEGDIVALNGEAMEITGRSDALT